jgi:hypothetical protein
MQESNRVKKGSSSGYLARPGAFKVGSEIGSPFVFLEHFYDSGWTMKGVNYDIDKGLYKIVVNDGSRPEDFIIWMNPETYLFGSKAIASSCMYFTIHTVILNLKKWS